MLKRFSVALTALLGVALWVHAQDLPALPPLPGDAGAPAATSLPPLPGEAAAPAPASSDLPTLPALPGDSTAPASSALPALPGDSNAPASSALPALPGDSTAPTSSALPALPGEMAAPAAVGGEKPALSEKELKKQKKEEEKALKKLNKERKKQDLEPLTELPKEGVPATTVSSPAVGLPTLPGETAAAPGTLPGETVAPVAEASGNTPAASETAAVKKTKPTIHKWHAPDFGPNVIFGGMVRTKGGTDEEKLAWVSQHVLNGMDFNGFDVQKEEGAYAGQDAEKEWRQFTFVPRKKKSVAPIVIYVEPSKGNVVYLRVGPGEPPAGVPAKDVKQMRQMHQQVLNIMKKQLKGALRPVGGRWENPYRRPNG